MHILNFPGFTTVTKLDTHGVGVDTGFIMSIFVNLSLNMHNNTTIKPIGKCKLKLVNPKNNEQFIAEFVVTKDGTLTKYMSAMSAFNRVYTCKRHCVYFKVIIVFVIRFIR
jgi:hypothetical protein